MSDVFHRIIAMVHGSVPAEWVCGLDIIRRQGLEAEDRDAVAHEVEILHVARDVVCCGGETGKRKAGVEVLVKGYDGVC
jgi:hypothetical protein